MYWRSKCADPASWQTQLPGVENCATWARRPSKTAPSANLYPHCFPCFPVGKTLLPQTGSVPSIRTLTWIGSSRTMHGLMLNPIRLMKHRYVDSGPPSILHRPFDGAHMLCSGGVGINPAMSARRLLSLPVRGAIREPLYHSEYNSSVPPQVAFQFGN